MRWLESESELISGIKLLSPQSALSDLPFLVRCAVTWAPDYGTHKEAVNAVEAVWGDPGTALALALATCDAQLCPPPISSSISGQ